MDFKTILFNKSAHCKDQIRNNMNTMNVISKIFEQLADMKSWIAKQLTSISTCFIFSFLSNEMKILDFITLLVFTLFNSKKINEDILLSN